MQQAIPSLEDLRREIDEVDDAIHKLIMRRAGLVSQVAYVKGMRRGGKSPRFLRPAREAAVLRRLMAQHRGPFPKPALVRLWREIITAPFALQGDFSVAVYAPKEEPGYWDLARDHYGGSAPFTAFQTPGHVIAALVDGNAMVGVLPLIHDDDSDPWWRLLANDGEQTPAIIARLPMAPSVNVRGEQLGALAVARVAFEPTGRDHAYLAIEADEEMSRASLRSQLTNVDLDARVIAMWRAPDAAQQLYLLEASHFVSEKDGRLAALLAAAGSKIRRVFFLGGYATPFAPEELVPTAEG
ncbi:MAG TPA: chorismate mutase [Alphaproteobacteria bacterium]|nr:chorismate mutase [Alphaproteobacteria bacterium]